MRTFLRLPADAYQRRWLLQVMGLLLGLALSTASIWRYYDYKVQQLDRQVKRLEFHP